MRKQKLLLGYLVLAFVTLSCGKGLLKEEKTAKENETAKETQKNMGTMSMPLYCEDLENPCTDPACAPYYDCDETPPPDLATQLANHSSFINFNVNFDAALNMPTPDNFIQLFDSAQLSSQGDSYLSNITGISLGSITSITNAIKTNAQSMWDNFPELRNKSQVELDSIVLLATDIYLANPPARMPCNDCRRNGRRNMVVRTFLGMATGGSFGGFYGGWIGAVFGFWDAAAEAQNCLKDCTS